MYPSTQASSTEELGPLAEEIRAYLVEIRGGAPFLSGADGLLLLEWLEARVPVPLILACIDKVAERRRKKRVRSRLTLKACQGEVRKALKRQAARHPDSPLLTEVPADRTPTTVLPHRKALIGLRRELEAIEVTPELGKTWETLLTALDRLTGSDLSLEKCCTLAIGATRIFHREAWDAMRLHHEELRRLAREELAHLEGAVSERIFSELLEEAARDQLRRRFPLVSADQLWDRLQP